MQRLTMLRVRWVEVSKFNFPGDYLTCGCGHSFIPKGKEQATGARSPEEHHQHGMA